MTSEVYKFLMSKTWRNKRREILNRDGHVCQYYKHQGVIMPAQVVHHIFPLAEYPEYALENWNLISLSKKAHSRLENAPQGMTSEGKRILRETAMKQGIEIPEKYL